MRNVLQSIYPEIIGFPVDMDLIFSGDRIILLKLNFIKDEMNMFRLAETCFVAVCRPEMRNSPIGAQLL